MWSSYCCKPATQPYSLFFGGGGGEIFPCYVQQASVYSLLDHANFSFAKRGLAYFAYLSLVIYYLLPGSSASESEIANYKDTKNHLVTRRLVSP